MISGTAAAKRKTLVVDANILIRAVLGRVVLALLRTYGGRADFIAPEMASIDAMIYLPTILTKRGMPSESIDLF